MQSASSAKGIVLQKGRMREQTEEQKLEYFAQQKAKAAMKNQAAGLKDEKKAGG